MRTPITYEPARARPSVIREPARVATYAYLALIAAVILACALFAPSIASGSTDAQAATIKQLTTERNNYRREYRVQRWRHLKHHKVWSEKSVRWALSEACRDYGIKGADRTWVIDNGTHIAYGESRFNTKARNGQHRGLFQFNASWAGSEAQKLSGRWSTRRFVRVFRDGGRAAVARHWRSTL